MKLIIGLGNVGSRYARTRHNIGFMVVDELAFRFDATWKLSAKLKAATSALEIDGEKVVLAKPNTMMNLSGEAVQRIIQFYKATPNDVWAVYDDVDTSFGRMRVRHRGSAGGHQGVRSLIHHIGEGFLRVRVGISLNDRAVEPSEIYVLKPFTVEEIAMLPGVVQGAAETIAGWVGGDQTSPDEVTIDLR